MNRSARILLGALAVTVVWFVWQWYTLARQREKQAPRGGDVLLGFVANFFDTLGIGCFAPTTAAFKLFRRVPDELIPGTLNVGHAIPAITDAFIFIAAVTVEPTPAAQAAGDRSPILTPTAVSEG